MHWHVIFTGGKAACTLGSFLISTPICPVPLHTLVHFGTSRSYQTRRSDHTAPGGMHLSHFSVNFSVSSLDTAARLVTSSFVLRFRPWFTTCCCSETKLWGVLFQAPRSSAPHVVTGRHSSLAMLLLLQRLLEYLRASLQRRFDKWKRQIDTTGEEESQEHETRNTHAQCCKRSQSPKGGVTLQPTRWYIKSLQTNATLITLH